MEFHKHVSAKKRHQIFFSFILFPRLLSASPSETIDDSVSHRVSSVFSVRPALETHHGGRQRLCRQVMPSPPSSLREKSDRNPRGTKTLSVVAAAPPCSLVFSLRTTIETDKGSDSVGNSRRLLRYLVFTVRRGQHDLDADYLNEVGIAFTFSVFIGYDWI